MIYISFTFYYFFITLEHLWIFFFTLFWIVYQLGYAFERTFPRAPRFNKRPFGVTTQVSPFPRFVSLWVPYTLSYSGEGHGKHRNRFMQSMDNTLHDPHAVCHEIALPSVLESVLARTRGQIEEMYWHFKSPPHWNEALGEMFSQKRNLTDILFKTMWKKIQRYSNSNVIKK